MKTSRVAIFHKAGQPLTFDAVPVPPPGPGEILVRNEYTTLCRSDLNTFVGKRIEKTPTILGHETVGRIEELGPGAPSVDGRGAPLRTGDRVTWAIYASDPTSGLARAGIPQKGDGLFKYGHERITANSHLHGGLSEYCLLRRHTPVIRIDDPVPLPVLALINCAVATVAGSLRLAGRVSDQTLLIAGAGMLGIIACAMARTMGARTIVVADIDDRRLASASDFGADLTLNLKALNESLPDHLASRLSGEPVTLALDFSGVPETMEALLAALGIGGTLALVGATFPQRPLRIDAENLVRRLHTLKGLHNYNQQDLVAAVDFVERHYQRFPLAGLVHDGFTLDQANEAFQHGLTSGRHRVGIRLHPPTPSAIES